MVATKDEVCRIAARELGIVGAAQQADGPTFAIIQDKFDGVLADLRAREIAAWGENATPDEVKDALGVYIAQKCANSLATGPEVRQHLVGLGGKAYMDVLAVAGRKWSGNSTKADRF